MQDIYDKISNTEDIPWHNIYNLRPFEEFDITMKYK